MGNKITDGNPLKAKLSIFIEEQGATSVENLWNEGTDHESLRATVVEKTLHCVANMTQIALEFLLS